MLDLRVKQVLTLQMECFEFAQDVQIEVSQVVQISTEIKRKSLILAQIERWRRA